MSEEIFLERMTSPQIAARLGAGWRTVIVPCGAVEQHGPHLPLCVDAEHGTRLGEEVARRMGHTLVAPTIRVGCSAHHMAFPGSLSLEPTTFLGVCRDYCTSLARHGFEKICFLPTHGGNFRPLAESLEELSDAAGPACTVIAYTDLVGVLDCWKQSVEGESGLGARVGGHADIAESSVMLVLQPDLVRPELAERGYLPEMDEDVIRRIIEEGFDSVTPNGILGDARGMSESIGTRCIEDLANLVAASFSS